MTESPNRKRALEILGDPRSNEKEWMGALAILDGKVPSVQRRHLALKMARYWKRVTGLTVMYMALFSIYGLVFYGQALSLSLLPAALLWGMLEAGFGAFTMLALWVMFANIGSILTLSPYYQTTWIVVLLNVLVYAKGNWRPYVFVPVQKMLQARGAKAPLLIRSNE